MLLAFYDSKYKFALSTSYNNEVQMIALFSKILNLVNALNHILLILV